MYFPYRLLRYCRPTASRPNAKAVSELLGPIGTREEVEAERDARNRAAEDGDWACRFEAVPLPVIPLPTAAHRWHSFTRLHDDGYAVTTFSRTGRPSVGKVAYCGSERGPTRRPVRP